MRAVIRHQSGLVVLFVSSGNANPLDFSFEHIHQTTVVDQK